MIDFTVKPDGGDPYTVTATSRDIVVFEKTGNRTLDHLLEDKSFVDLYRLAHIASRRQGMYAGTLDEFEAGVDLDFDLEDTGSDPTP